MSGKITTKKAVIEVSEFCSKNRAKWLLKNVDKVPIRSFNDPNYKPKELVKEYCESILKSKKSIIKKEYTNDCGFGRLFVKGVGYQNLMREYRSILAIEDYYDIDIYNCQPTILNQYCQKNNIETVYLNKYCINREKYIKRFEEDGVNKDELKLELIKVIYGGKYNNEFLEKLERDNYKFCKKFQEEISSILEEVQEREPEIAKYAEKQAFLKDKKYCNIKGSTTAYLCQDIENVIIQHSIEFFKKQKFDIGALCFDGLMIRKTKEITSKTIENLNKFIETETGYRIEFRLKEFEEIIKISEEELNEDEVQAKYDIMKKEVEKDYFFIENPSVVGYFDPNTKGLVLKRPSDIQNVVFKNKKIEYIDDFGKNKKIYFYDKWVEDESRRIYKGLIFDPFKNDEEYLNLFTGFEYDQEITVEKDIKPVLDFLKEVLQDGYEYILDWIAHIIQYRTRTERAPILYSNAHGVGKSSITTFIGLLLGDKYSAHISKFDDIEKEFNSQFENKLFVTADEIKAKSNDSYDRLKAVITATKLSINRKGIDSYECENLCNYMFTTNNYNPVKIDDKDRRIDIIQCRETVLDQEIYNKFQEEIKNKDVMINVFNFFKERKVNRKLGEFKSEHKRDLQNNYINSSVKYVYTKAEYLIEEGTITATDLFNKIKEYEKSHNFTNCTSVKDMSIKLNWMGLKKRTNKHIVYSFEDKERFLQILKDNNKELYETHCLDLEDD